MKVLLIGSGGREHAIAYALKKSPKIKELHAIPGNPGISELATCHAGDVADIDSILKFVKENEIDFTVVGPEVPLCLGLVDLLEDNGYKAFGPRKLAATLEGSKAFAKEFMVKHNIPTALYKEVTNYNDAVNALAEFSYPVVIKADGLAAGKGVVICDCYEMAIGTLKEMMLENSLGDAANKIILEEFLTGYECSLLCFVDGDTIIPMVSAKDHKQIYDNNQGPNTGGMGTVSPNPFLPKGIDEVLEEEVLKPFLEGLKKDNIDYRGVVFIGLMIDNNKPKVLEFNVRFGDPETQVIMLRLDCDLLDVMLHISEKRLKDIEVKFKDEEAICLVLASSGYPGKYEKGKLISGLDNLPSDIVVFHAGTKLVDGKLVTNGGRVLNVCALASNLNELREKVYKASELITFEGKYCRKDIGLN